MRPVFFTIIKLILYYFAYQLGFSVLATGASLFISSADMDIMITMTSLGVVASNVMMAWHLIHFGYVNLTRDRCKEVNFPVLGVSAVFIFSAMYVLNLLIEQAGIPNTKEDIFLAMCRNPLGVLSIALFAPILEELLFRGAIQGHLQRVLHSPWKAIFIASLIFGVVHMNPAQILFAFLLGMLFGWLCYRTGSLLPGIVGHVLNNSIAAFNMILYGNATIEDQIENPFMMWVWAVVAVVVCVCSALWLNHNLNR